MSIKLMTAVWAVALPHADKIVLLALADNANDEGMCFPSITTLQRKCGMAERSVRRVISRLVEEGHLTVHDRPGRSCTYDVHPGPSVTPDRPSPRTVRHPTPDPKSPPPRTMGPDTPVRPSPITIIEPPIEPSGNRKSRARPRTRLVPDDFEVTEAMRQWAAEECKGIDIDLETKNFRDHEFRDPHTDWTKAWRKWMRRSLEFKSNGRGLPSGKKTFDERMAALDREIERVEGKQ